MSDSISVSSGSKTADRTLQEASQDRTVNDGRKTEIYKTKINGSIPDKVKGSSKKQGNTYTAVSAVAYLIGVRKRDFKDKNNNLQVEIHDKLECDKTARLIRYFSKLRLTVMKRYERTDDLMNCNAQEDNVLEKFLAPQMISELEKAGMWPLKNMESKAGCLMEIDGYMKTLTDSLECEYLQNIDHEHIKHVLLFPKGTDKGHVGTIINWYMKNTEIMPYGCYMNLKGMVSMKNNHVKKMLETDTDLKNILQELSISQEQDSKSQVLKVYEHMNVSDKVILSVDCENSDPYKLSEFLEYVKQQGLASKIEKVMLYNDSHACKAWDILSDLTDIHMETIMVERLNDHKSILDLNLAVRTVTECRSAGISSVIIASSDSDYWGFVSNVRDIRFCILTEQIKTSDTYIRYLDSMNIPHCDLELFASDGVSSLKELALLDEVKRLGYYNIYWVVEECCKKAKTTMSDFQKEQFCKKYKNELLKPFSEISEVSEGAET